MTLDQQKKLAAHLQRLLKVRHVSFPIAKTEKGDLSVKYIKDTDGYELILDAVPLDQKDYDNRELKSLLEKYLFEQEDIRHFEGTPITTKMIEDAGPNGVIIVPSKKKPGRPKKVK